MREYAGLEPVLQTLNDWVYNVEQTVIHDGERTMTLLEELTGAVSQLTGVVENQAARIRVLEEESEQRDRQFGATQANLNKAAEALKRASETEKKPKGRLP